MDIRLGYESFKKAWKAKWQDENETEATIGSKYNNLSIMLEIEPGDYIIVPKMSMKEESVCRSFVVAKCKEKYRFSLLKGVGDFGHIIEVDDIFSCYYDANQSSHNINSKFIGYQSPLNRVKNQLFIDAADQLIKLHAENPEEFEKDNPDLISIVGSATESCRRDYLETIKQALQGLPNHKFEDLISELFRRIWKRIIDLRYRDLIATIFRQKVKNTWVYKRINT